MDFTLTVPVTSQEGASGPTASTNASLNVTVNPVADAPLVTTSAASGAADAASIPPIFPVALTDDGSEVLQSTVQIDGIPEVLTFSIMAS